MVYSEVPRLLPFPTFYLLMSAWEKSLLLRASFPKQQFSHSLFRKLGLAKKISYFPIRKFCGWAHAQITTQLWCTWTYLGEENRVFFAIILTVWYIYCHIRKSVWKLQIRVTLLWALNRRTDKDLDWNCIRNPSGGVRVQRVAHCSTQAWILVVRFINQKKEIRLHGSWLMARLPIQFSSQLLTELVYAMAMSPSIWVHKF